MKSKFKWVGVIVIGMMLVGVQTVYAEDNQANGALEEIAANREAVIIDLAEYWAAESEESVEVLMQMFHGATNEQLLEIEQASSYEDVLEDLGDLYEDLVYTPVTPCKIVDTRSGGGGFIAAGATRKYNVLNTSGQGGSYCSSPVGYPSAAHLAVTVVDPNGKGNLKVFPANTSGSTGLTINFAQIGTNLANAGTTKVVYGSGDDIGVKASYAGCHVTIQVLGYYTRPEVTKLQAYSTYTSKTIAGGGTLYAVYSPKCTTDYVATGGGCGLQYAYARDGLETSRPYPSTGSPIAWECRGRNGESFSINVTSHVTCVRIPGR